MRAHVIADKLAILAKSHRRSVAHVTELHEERAAIREYEGLARRADADRDALVDVANILGA